MLLLMTFTVIQKLRCDANVKKTDLSVGYLTAIKGNVKDRQGLAISGAITMALGKFNFYKTKTTSN